MIPNQSEELAPAETIPPPSARTKRRSAQLGRMLHDATEYGAAEMRWERGERLLLTALRAWEERNRSSLSD